MTATFPERRSTVSGADNPIHAPTTPNSGGPRGRVLLRAAVNAVMIANRLASGARAATAQGNSEEGDREEGRVSLRAAANAVMATNRLARGARAATAQGDSEGNDREEGHMSLRAAANVVIAANRISDGERASTTEI